MGWNGYLPRREKTNFLSSHGLAAEIFADPRNPRTRAYPTGEIS